MNLVLPHHSHGKLEGFVWPVSGDSNIPRMCCDRKTTQEKKKWKFFTNQPDLVFLSSSKMTGSWACYTKKINKHDHRSSH